MTQDVKQIKSPTVDPSRQEYGFNATTCACEACNHFCTYLPGFLAVSDLQRLFGFLGLGASLEEFAEKYLNASPGAKALTAKGVTSIPTLVPARKEDGSCIFLTENKLCGIHAVAPYGCRFFDDHMPAEDGDKRATAALLDIMANVAVGGDYSRIWRHLNHCGLKAPSPDVLRKNAKPTLAFEPEDSWDLTARFDAALEPVVEVPKNRNDGLSYRPGAHRQHVFDFRDGTRLIVSRDSDGAREFVHFSGSLTKGTPLYEKTLEAVRLDPKKALQTALSDFVVCFLKISDYDGKPGKPEYVSDHGTPHWFIPWDTFRANRSKKEQPSG